MDWKNTIEKKLTAYLGASVVANNITSVSGGSINETYKVATNNGDFFVKKNSAAIYPSMFEKEALGLNILRNANEINTPEVINFSDDGKDSFLILKHIKEGNKSDSFWDDFGCQLSNLHKHTNKYFGLDHDNYIGSLWQHNDRHDSWKDFFVLERLERQVRLARERGCVDKQIVASFDRFYTAIDNIFPKEPPALLHGDLWNGNFMVNDIGDAVIIDPAVYFGHREMDLGMSQLFGGFDNQFYISYNKRFPLENGWEKRIIYCNLYPLMVHVNLFGGAYIQSVKTIIGKF